MKLHKKLIVGGKSFSLVDESIRLGLTTPGRASFTVIAGAKISGVVVFSLGYKADNLSDWFIGFVDECTTIDHKQQRIFCRELSAVLFSKMPLALQDVNLSQVLAALTLRTGLQFITPKEGGYTTKRTAVFYNLANGYFVLDALPRVFGYRKPIWQQQTNGKIFVGSWDDSSWPRRPLELPNDWETDVSTANCATVPALPKLRPGALYNGNVLTGVDLEGVKMRITWNRNPWK